MKDVIIIYAHPRHSGHNWLIRQEVETQLQNNNIPYKVLDLYKDGFDPVLYDSQLYTAGGKERDTFQIKYQKIIADADNLIFIYPVWWNTMPAMLKGFLDKVFVQNLAFKYKRFPLIPFAIPVPLWRGKKATILNTMGAKWWQVRLVLGRRNKQVICKDVLGFCGVKAKGYSLYNCTKNPKIRQPEIQKLARNAIRRIKKI